MLVVGVGRTEAKVEGLFSEVCRLDYKGNVLDSMGGEVLKGVRVPWSRDYGDVDGGKCFSVPLLVASGAGRKSRRVLCVEKKFGVTLRQQRIFSAAAG